MRSYFFPKIDNEVVSNPDLLLSDDSKSKRALVTTKIANPYTAQEQYQKVQFIRSQEHVI